MDIPVYLFMGFLDAGKTTYISNLITKSNFTQNKRFLLLVCEEGETEYDVAALRAKKVEVRTVEDASGLTPAHLNALAKETKAQRIAIEYNAMWTLAPLAEGMPENWYVFQSVTLFDTPSFPLYNANMRSQVYEMLTSSSMVVFNKIDPGADVTPCHKAVRAVNRQTDIFYRFANGAVKKDEVVDPLPFDTEAPVIEIADRDYALWFGDMYDHPEKYHKKTVKFLAWADTDEECPPNCFMAGRHMMTCCANDVQYAWLPCLCDTAADYRFPAWCTVTGVLNTEDEANGGISLKVLSVSPAKEPAEPVVSFY